MRFDRENGSHVLLGDTVALPPALHSGMIAVAERAGEGSNAAARFDDGGVIFHTPSVRYSVRDVNVESVSRFCDLVYVADEQTTGERLAAFRIRSGMTFNALAVAAGYAGGSSIQKYLDPAYDQPLSVDVAIRFANALEGKGSPPITRVEVLSLAPVPVDYNGQTVTFDQAAVDDMIRDIPVYGTALGAPTMIDGMAIEQTTLNSGDVVAYMKRPAALEGRPDVYGVYVQGSSMAPRYDEGSLVFVDGKRPPRIGDDVIVYLRDNTDDDGERARAVLVKRLVRRTFEYVELEQFSPPLTFRIPSSDAMRMHRVIPFQELFS